VNNPFYLIAGYGITVAAIVAYLLRLRRLERAAERQLKARGPGA
jgi:hypothetical protein